MTTATGVGSWPGTSAREAVRAVRDLLGPDGLPYLPETPTGDQGPIWSVAAPACFELPVDLQPMGWRFVDRPGRDAARPPPCSPRTRRARRGLRRLVPAR